MENVLQAIYDASKKIQGRLYISKEVLLQYGWEGQLPTQIYGKYGQYWIRYERGSNSFLLVKVTEDDMVKGEKGRDENRPLMLGDVPRINVMDLYKKKMSEKTN